MRILLTRWFDRFARKEGLSTDRMVEAIDRASRGLVDADLGHGLIKQRIARAGKGRSSGYRVVIVYRMDDRAIFLFGFAKSEQADLSPREFAALRDAAADYLRMNDTELDVLVAEKRCTELKDVP